MTSSPRCARRVSSPRLSGSGSGVLADRERVQGNKHPDTLATAQQLAEAYVADGRAKTALSLLKRVVADREKILGARHLDTIGARSALADANHSAGKMASAVQFYERVRAGYTEVLGGDHRLALSASLNLAHALYAVGRQSDGAKLVRETAERCDLHLPAGDPLTASAIESLRIVSGGGSPDASASAGQEAPAGQETSGGTAPAGQAASEPLASIGRRVTGRHRPKLSGGCTYFPGVRQPRRPPGPRGGQHVRPEHRDSAQRPEDVPGDH